MVQGQESSVLKAQSHMDTGETKAEPAVLNLAVLHGQVGARPQQQEPVPWHLLCWTSHSLWEEEPEQLCTWAEKLDMESHVSG